ncbi:4Fe-4S binding protein [Wukongibacter baidiensis]|uniref:4Fe-4S binding protein n=1 Tax=Wukongibacter baidiensis TaxID=1723361 RepID=UPI003D7FA62E
MITKLRPLIQVVFLGVFAALMFLGKAQFWMAFIFISIALSAFFGRYYCGFACPINTLIRPVSWISKKLGLQKKDVPKAFKTEKARWVLFAIFLVGLGYTIYTIKLGKKFPLPVFIITLGLITTFFINEKTWHRYLCPWGVLFSLTGRFAKLGLVANNCVSCSACVRACPGDAIKIESNKAVVDSTHCLLCLECQNSCPIDALDYESLKKKENA